ncbi:hypothetical protein INR49_013056 [Caranx melampygus]|nr:hypothetical protein INR49_013056 [Caranx melampygus]
MDGQEIKLVHPASSVQLLTELLELSLSLLHINSHLFQALHSVTVQLLPAASLPRRLMPGRLELLGLFLVRLHSAWQQVNSCRAASSSSCRKTTLSSATIFTLRASVRLVISLWTQVEKSCRTKGSYRSLNLRLSSSSRDRFSSSSMRQML